VDVVKEAAERKVVAAEQVKVVDSLVAAKAAGREVSMRNQSMPNQTHGKKELEYGETQPKRNDMKEQRGGPQSDQAAGETDKGAHNQAAKGRNPRGNSVSSE
jgi:hypothetical protein